MACPVCGREYIYGGGDWHAKCRDVQKSRARVDEAVAWIMSDEEERDPNEPILVTRLRNEINDGVASIDVAHLDRQREWSKKTFGPGPRTEGVLDHIAKELEEIRAAPEDLGEWVDVIILAFDGAWRAGHASQDIINAIVVKQARNERRVWPDWREFSENQAIEHDRSVEG